MESTGTRAFSFVIYGGMLSTGLALSIAAALDDFSADAMKVLLAVGAALIVGGVGGVGGGVIAWLLIDKPVDDPYEAPPPDYGRGER